MQKIKEIDLILKSKNLTKEQKKQLEKKKEVLLNNKHIDK